MNNVDEEIKFNKKSILMIIFGFVFIFVYAVIVNDYRERNFEQLQNSFMAKIIEIKPLKGYKIKNVKE